MTEVIELSYNKWGLKTKRYMYVRKENLQDLQSYPKKHILKCKNMDTETKQINRQGKVKRT